ncbi:unnamed protein product [Pleuronectes platessa]|uniref:Uncharacterized protein n=1 Tax=Pleuronectes platessa TaxID=8262 RepID=A0A9N7Z715_PLEPL|nr:unnamed protein product [Pleuronectes platessa]
MPVHHIHHRRLTSLTAGYREMTSSIKLESMPVLSCCTHYSVPRSAQHRITTLLSVSLHISVLKGLGNLLATVVERRKDTKKKRTGLEGRFSSGSTSAHFKVGLHSVRLLRQ